MTAPLKLVILPELYFWQKGKCDLNYVVNTTDMFQLAIPDKEYIFAFASVWNKKI